MNIVIYIQRDNIMGKIFLLYSDAQLENEQKAIKERRFQADGKLGRARVMLNAETGKIYGTTGRITVGKTWILALNNIIGCSHPVDGDTRISAVTEERNLYGLEGSRQFLRFGASFGRWLDSLSADQQLRTLQAVTDYQKGAALVTEEDPRARAAYEATKHYITPKLSAYRSAGAAGVMLHGARPS